VVIDANTRLAVAVGTPVPGNRNDCRAYADSGVDQACLGAAVLADGGYQGTRLVLPYRPATGGGSLPGWKENLNRTHRRVRTRLEHTLVHVKTWKILRDCRLKGDGVWYAAQGVALMRNLAITG